MKNDKTKTVFVGSILGLDGTLVQDLIERINEITDTIPEKFRNSAKIVDDGDGDWNLSYDRPLTKEESEQDVLRKRNQLTYHEEMAKKLKGELINENVD